MGTLRVVLGGARSGKSRFAERLAQARDRPVLYVATAEASDAEMAARIALHRADRPVGWRTLEAPRDLERALASESAFEGTALVDCLSVWLSNELLARLPANDAGEVDGLIAPDVAAGIEADLLGAVGRLVRWAAARRGETIVVTNETGAGVVPAYPLGRLYRDLLGRANQALAADAEAVYLVVAGIGVDLRRLEADFGGGSEA